MSDTPNMHDASPSGRSWMVEIALPVPFDQEFLSRIPEQRLMIGKLMSAGMILSYTLTADRSKLWTVILASSEEEVRKVLTTFPIISWTRYSIHELFFHEYSLGGIPSMSLN